MEWLYFRCSWCLSVNRTASDAPLVTCPQCGGEITEIDEPPDALWATDTLVSRDQLQPGTPMRPRSVSLAHARDSLASMVLDVVERGTPMLVSPPIWTGRPDDLGVVLHVTDVRYLAGQVALDIDRFEPAPATVGLRIDPLGATGEGPTLALALAALTATARRRSQALLRDPLTPSGIRAVALRVWLADAAQQLPDLLGDHLPAE